MLKEWTVPAGLAVPDWLPLRVRLLPGLLLCAAIAVAAQWVSQTVVAASYGLSALTLAILLGLLVGNTQLRNITNTIMPGVNFAKHYLLRLGIVLYGFKLTFQSIGIVGAAGLMVDAVVLLGTFALAMVLGCRVFRLEQGTVMLIGIGHSICGAAAIMAAEPVLKARNEQVIIAITTIVLFGTLAIFVYPALYQLAVQQGWWLANEQLFGLFVGSTVHEVAQVVAVGDAVSAEATDIAVIAKMVRVMLLAPFLLALSAGLVKWNGAQGGSDKGLLQRLQVPWFAFVFIAVIGVNSFVNFSALALERIATVDTAALAMAMAALGLGTNIRTFRHAGMKPLVLAALLSVWLILGGGAINYVVLQFFNA